MHNENTLELSVQTVSTTLSEENVEAFTHCYLDLFHLLTFFLIYFANVVVLEWLLKFIKPELISKWKLVFMPDLEIWNVLPGSRAFYSSAHWQKVELKMHQSLLVERVREFLQPDHPKEVLYVKCFSLVWIVSAVKCNNSEHWIQLWALKHKTNWWQFLSQKKKIFSF